MGYGSYELASGKMAGYAVPAVCEHPGCEVPIDRGMSYACGNEPGDQGGCSCEGYFCAEHLWMAFPEDGSHEQTELGEITSLCLRCFSWLAHLGKIEDAEMYASDPVFALTEEQQKAYKIETGKDWSPP